MSDFEKIIREKFDSFEYPYDPGSFESFVNSIPPRKFPYLKYIAFLSPVPVIISVCLLLYFNENEPATQLLLPDKPVKNNVIVNNTKISENTSDAAVIDSKKETENTIIKDKCAVAPNTGSQISSKEPNINGENKIKNNNGNSAEPKQVAPDAAFSANIKEGCSPLTVQFTPKEISDTVIYSWDFGDGRFSTGRCPAHSYSKPGIYNVLLMVKYFKSEPVVSNYQKNLVKVFDKPVAKFSFASDNNSFTFSDESQGSVKSKWIFPDTVAYDESITRNFRKTGKYSVTLVVTNASGCSDSITNPVYVEIKLQAQLGNSFSPDGDGINDVFGPQVERPEDFNFEFTVTNISGQTVHYAKGKNVDWNGIDKNTGNYVKPGEYFFYSLRILDKFGNTNEKTGKITIKPL